MTKVYLNNVKNLGKPKQAPVKKNTVVKPKDEDLDTEDFDALMRAFLDSIK